MVTPSFLRRKARQRLNQIAAAAIPQTFAPNTILQGRQNAYYRDTFIRVEAIREHFPGLDAAASERLLDLSDPFSPSSEPVEWYWERKASGFGFRQLCDFGPELTVRHKMIAAALDAQLSFAEPFYDRRGTGALIAVQKAVEALENHGRFILTADIKDCFPSINIDGIYQSGTIPAKVIENALDPRHLTFIRKEAPDQNKHNLSLGIMANMAAKEEVPQGLLHGCSAANAILRHLLANAVSKLDNQVRVFVYVDNFFVVAKTEQACLDALETLSCHLAVCPAGPLHFGTSDINHIDAGAEMLGYHLMGCTDGSVQLSLSGKNLVKAAMQVIDGSKAGIPIELLRADLIAKFPLIDLDILDEVLDHHCVR